MEASRDVASLEVTYLSGSVHWAPESVINWVVIKLYTGIAKREMLTREVAMRAKSLREKIGITSI